MLTDFKDASALFNLLDDDPMAFDSSTIRYIDYSNIYDDITKKSYKIDEIENYPSLNFQDHDRSAHFFTLKYKPKKD